MGENIEHRLARPVRGRAGIAALGRCKPAALETTTDYSHERGPLPLVGLDWCARDGGRGADGRLLRVGLRMGGRFYCDAIRSG